MKKILIFVSVFLLLCSSFWFYAFKYPVNVTKAAHEGVVVGEDLSSLFKNNHPFLDALKKGRGNNILFSSKDDRSVNCLSIHLSNTQPVIMKEVSGTYQLVWKGEFEDFGVELDKLKSELIKCNQLCGIFMPAMFYRGSFCTTFDQDLKITSKENPRFWD